MISFYFILIVVLSKCLVMKRYHHTHLYSNCVQEVFESKSFNCNTIDECLTHVQQVCVWKLSHMLTQ